MNPPNHNILRLLPLDRVLSPRHIRETSAHIYPDPFEVKGAERTLRLNAGFQAENANGPAGVIAQALLWRHAQQLEPSHLQQFRERVGFNQPQGLFDLREELLNDMAATIGAMYDELGPELAIWGIILLAARPQKGGTDSLMADVAKCRAMGTATEILEYLAAENMRRDDAERYQ